MNCSLLSEVFSVSVVPHSATENRSLNHQYVITWHKLFLFFCWSVKQKCTRLRLVLLVLVTLLIQLRFKEEMSTWGRFKCVLAFDKTAAASSFLQTLVFGWWVLWERYRGIQVVQAIHVPLEVGFGVEDSGDPGEGWRGATVALVHPAPITYFVQLKVHLPSQVALSPIVQGLHGARRVFLCVELLVFRLKRKVKLSSVGSFWTPAGEVDDISCVEGGAAGLLL